MSVVWITHDLALIAGLADRIIVLYAGTVVEDAPVDDLYRPPAASLYTTACSPRSRSCRQATKPSVCRRSAARRPNRDAGRRAVPSRHAVRAR